VKISGEVLGRFRAAKIAGKGNEEALEAALEQLRKELEGDEACSAAYFAALEKLRSDNWHNGRESARGFLRAALDSVLGDKEEGR